MGPPASGSGALSCLIIGWEHEAFRGLLENKLLLLRLHKMSHLLEMFDIFNDTLIVTIKQTLLNLVFYSFITQNVKAQG